MPKGRKKAKGRKPKKGLTPRGGFMPPSDLSPFPGRRLSKARVNNSTFRIPNVK